MNLGIRDAIQLGRALSDILKRDNDPNTSPSAAKAYADKKLEAYTEERRKLAVGVIKITKFMTWATGLQAPPAQRARNALYWTIGRGSTVSKKFTLRLSGLEAAERPFAIKLRADCSLDHLGFLDLYERFAERTAKERIVACAFFTVDPHMFERPL